MTTAQRAARTGPEADELLEQLATPQASVDPYPIYESLRRFGPIEAVASGAVSLFLTEYADCARVIRDPAFGVQTPQWCERMTPGWLEQPASWAFQAMLFRDPPDHSRLRRAVADAFTPRQAGRMGEEVGRMVRQAMDRLADAGADGGVTDLQEILATSLPISVMGTLIGIPATDWPTLRRAMVQILKLGEFVVAPGAQAEADDATMILRGYFGDLVAKRRAEPTDDLATMLVSQTDAGPAADGAPMAEEELLQMLAFVFMGGVDTMTNLLANGALALLQHQEQAKILRQQPQLVPGAVDEILRYDAPVQVVPRVAASETAIDGLVVHPDQLIVSIVGSANRDPARFPDPEVFDVTRTGPGALSFGGGMHYCLGAPLARVQAGTFFAELVRRFPTLRLAAEPARSGLIFRRMDYLPVALR
jgi:cytochrome P450